MTMSLKAPSSDFSTTYLVLKSYVAMRFCSIQPIFRKTQSNRSVITCGFGWCKVYSCGKLEFVFQLQELA